MFRLFVYLCIRKADAAGEGEGEDAGACPEGRVSFVRAAGTCSKMSAVAPVKDRSCFMMSAVAQVKVRCMSTNGTVCKSEGSHSSRHDQKCQPVSSLCAKERLSSFLVVRLIGEEAVGTVWTWEYDMSRARLFRIVSVNIGL